MGNAQAKDYQPFKICFWEFRGFEHEPPIFLAWLCSKPFSVPKNKKIKIKFASGLETCLPMVELRQVVKN